MQRRDAARGSKDKSCALCSVSTKIQRSPFFAICFVQSLHRDFLSINHLQSVNVWLNCFPSLPLPPVITLVAFKPPSAPFKLTLIPPQLLPVEPT